MSGHNKLFKLYALFLMLYASPRTNPMAERVIETDVLVVGGGRSGFRAAIGARVAGVKVILLSKGPLARCGATPLAGADFTLDGRSLEELGFPGTQG